MQLTEEYRELTVQICSYQNFVLKSMKAPKLMKSDVQAVPTDWLGEFAEAGFTTCTVVQIFEEEQIAHAGKSKHLRGVIVEASNVIYVLFTVVNRAHFYRMKCS